MSVTLMDEKGVEWIFTDQDIDDLVLQAFKNIGVGKGELRIWREHVLSGFLNLPDPSSTHDILIEAIQDAQVTGMLSKSIDLLIKVDHTLDHALKAHKVAVALHGKIISQ